MTKLYIYVNNFCDPLHNIGQAKIFGPKDADLVDEAIADYIQQADPNLLTRSRIFVTDDDIGFNDLDAYVVTDGFLVYGQNSDRFSSKVEEINIAEWADQYNERIMERNKRLREKEIAQSKRNLKEELNEAIKFVEDSGGNFNE